MVKSKWRRKSPILHSCAGSRQTCQMASCVMAKWYQVPGMICGARVVFGQTQLPLHSGRLGDSDGGLSGCPGRLPRDRSLASTEDTASAPFNAKARTRSAQGEPVECKSVKSDPPGFARRVSEYTPPSSSSRRQGLTRCLHVLCGFGAGGTESQPARGRAGQ